MYSAYRTKANQRKLHFVSHRLTRAQIRNGTDLLPSEPVVGNMGAPIQGLHTPFTMELYKAWNRLHDPTVDSGFDSINMTFDQPYLASVAGSAFTPHAK